MFGVFEKKRKRLLALSISSSAMLDSLSTVPRKWINKVKQEYYKKDGCKDEGSDLRAGEAIRDTRLVYGAEDIISRAVRRQNPVVNDIEPLI